MRKFLNYLFATVKKKMLTYLLTYINSFLKFPNKLSIGS